MRFRIICHDSEALRVSVDTYVTVKHSLGLKKDLPYTPTWSAEADFLRLITEHCLKVKPEVIVECSSGVTTLVLSRCCQLNGKGRVYSLENGEEYVAKTRAEVNSFCLNDYASVIHAPLQNHAIGNTNYDWYSVAELPAVPIDMLVIDGPPGFQNENARYPAIPVLIDRLADGCVILLDDAARRGEINAVEQWLSGYDFLTHEYMNTQRGCSVLTLNRNG